ncbi:Diphthamide biosynthesis protein 2 [Rhizina undulata]
MTIDAPTIAPALSTPDDHVFNADPTTDVRRSDYRELREEEFGDVYEIERTVREILENGWRKVALQFPDELLGDSERVYDLIYRGINPAPLPPRKPATENECVKEEGACCRADGESREQKDCCGGTGEPLEKKTVAEDGERKVFILADTSYSACCIDEIAAQHVAADGLVHYGRSCLSPTTRLPVIYVFTSRSLDVSAAASSFAKTFPEKSEKVILMADVTFHKQIQPLFSELRSRGYTNVFPTEILHNPSSPIPNRTLPSECLDDGEALKEYSLFHISPPLPSLLLILTSRLKELHTYNPTTASTTPENTASMLRRRYALLSHARSAGIVGILVNTLNVKNYLPVLSLLKRQIREAGKKSYLVVVGKVNVEKVANFSEIEVWVGVGCWEQGIVGGEQARGFWRPIVTPFELALAMKKGSAWTGEWVVDFESLLRIGEKEEKGKNKEGEQEEEEDDEEPEFDLRTGRYVSTSKPLSRFSKKSENINKDESSGTNPASSALTTTSKAKELAATGGVVSPAAEYLKNRAWRGLGSDIAYEEDGEKGAVLEVGRSGVARGYTVGGEGESH